jgi:hypothetical protein
MINSKLQQKWYTFRSSAHEGGVLPEEEQKKQRKEAQELEQEWMLEKNLHSGIRLREAKEEPQNSAYVTGIAGVKMRYVKQTKKRYSKAKKPGPKKLLTYVFYTPFIIVNSSYNREKFIKQFNVLTRGYDMAWYSAVSYFAEKKGIRSFDHLLIRKPPVQQWTIIRNWQNKQGYEIPENRQPKELLALEKAQQEEVKNPFGLL